MTAVPAGELGDVARRHDLKPEDVVWADRNPFGLLVGFKNGTSRYVEETQPPARSMNR